MKNAPIEILLQHWPGVLFRQTPDLRFDFISERIADWTGHAAEEWLKDPGLLLQSVHEEDVACVRKLLKRSVKSSGGITSRFRLRHLETGRVTHVTEFRRAVPDPKGKAKGHEGFWQDVTSLARAEQRLESAAWKDTLTRLTPAFAHDFNNIIAGVHGLSDTFLTQLAPDHPFHEGLTLVKRNTLQASQLVHRLQQLHLLRPGERTYHDLSAVVKDTAELLRRAISRRIDLATEFAPGQLAIHADGAELQQAIFALGFNAAEAIAERGTITFRTRAVAKPPRARHATGALPSPCVCLSVQDTGHGIASRDLPRVLDSDLSTKPGRDGLGLGLRHVRQFAERHAGAVSLESVEHQGTTVHLWLPQADLS